MSLPLAKLLIIAKPKGFNRNQVLTFAQAFRMPFQTISESNLTQSENAEIMEKYIEEELKPRGFSTSESFTILDLLTDLYGGDDQFPTEIDPVPPVNEEESETKSSINVVGKFIMNNDDGSSRTYHKNDVVYYEGKTFIASEDVTGWIPESTHPENMWQPIDLPENSIDGEEF